MSISPAKPIVIMAPTASGKTELALFLARQTEGEIISADSRQVYQRLTVGTAKPEGVWQGGVYRVQNIPYHLVDFLDVHDTFNAGSFAARCHVLQSQKPHTPFIFAGGTGMYLQSFFVGMDALPAGTPETRAELNALLEREGKQGLHDALRAADPASADQIPPGNVQRTMRALEIFKLTGTPASALRTGKFNASLPADKAVFVYLLWDKDALHARIEQRTNEMFDGMRAETQCALNDGVPADAPALKSLGYPEIIAHLNGELTREQAIERIIILTRQYAKRQRTWFNRYDNVLTLPLTNKQDFDLPLIQQRIEQWKPSF